MKQLAFILFMLAGVASCKHPIGKNKAAPIILFNGKDLAGWHTDSPKMDEDPGLKSPFVVQNGILVITGKPAGVLVTDAIYRNYRLEVEYRWPVKPGNSGVLVHASTPRMIVGVFPKCIEAQLQYGKAGEFNCTGEDITVPDMEARRGPKEQWGVTVGKRISIKKLTDKPEKPLGEWNTMIIECLNDSIRIWLNDDLVNDGFNCTAREGRIALQAEGTALECRKIILSPITKMHR
jgi:hypothetical protein